MATFGNLTSTRFGAAAASTNTYSTTINSVAWDASGNKYQFVEHDDAASVSVVPGGPVGVTTVDEGSTATGDISRSASLKPRGFAMCSLGPTNKFGWILLDSDDIQTVANTSAGTSFQIKTDGTVAAGGKLVWIADKVVDSRVDDPDSLERGTYMGMAHEDDSGSILTKATVRISY